MFRYTYIDKKGKLLCDVSEYVRKHNVVYKTPVKKVCDGLPLGNGYMGGLVYHTDRELCMRIGRTDNFDFGKTGNFSAWAHEWEEKTTTLAGCGQVKISDGTPAFAWEYLDDYNMTLDLGKAQIDLQSKTPFSEYKAVGYGNLEDKCIVWEVEAVSEEPVERTISLERYGTRGFFHYFESFTRDTKCRLYNITTVAEEDCILITQKLNGCTFTTGIHVACEEAKPVIRNKREGAFVLPASEKVSFKVYITTALTYGEGDTQAMAIAQLKAAAAKGSAVYEEHLEWWKEYWNRSFINIKNDFAENVYYMNRYQFGCSGFGSFPPSVFGSLWTAFGDTRNWGHYYHWNDQQQFWPCDTWNHGELLKSYFDYRFGMLPHAIEDCKYLHGIDGAWFADVASPDGYQTTDPDIVRNMSCGAMIAIQMYRHYRHFPDKEFLLNTAYPFMKACADMYLNLLVKEEDGRYHIHDVTAMEGYLFLNDPMNDWVMCRALFKALLDVAEAADAPEDLQAAWKDKLENLYHPPTQVKDGKTVFAYGRYADGSVCTGGTYPERGMAVSNVGSLMAVFPGSLYGCFSTEEPYFDIVKNSVESYREVYARIGWDIINQCFARFGYTKELNRNLGDFIQKYMVFPSGLMHFEPDSVKGTFTARVVSDKDVHTHWGLLHHKDEGERVTYPADPFFHFYSEPEGNLSTAINDSLLQSWEGIIRVFPAADEGVFRLHAEGDFMVTSQKTEGKVRFVAIESRRGGSVTLASPFTENECVRLHMSDHPYTMKIKGEQRLITFDTQPGETYIVFSRTDHIDGSYITHVFSSVNTDVKKCGERTIGLERNF